MAVWARQERGRHVDMDEPGEPEVKVSVLTGALSVDQAKLIRSPSFQRQLALVREMEQHVFRPRGRGQAAESNGTGDQ